MARSPLKHLPHRLLPRAAATTRLAASLAKAGAKRVVRRTIEDDSELGEALFGELDKLKGMAMKVGQILSYMEVGLPEHTQRRLAKLQRGAQPLALEVIATEIEVALGAPIDELFDDFEADPVAAASIGQVHRANFEGRPVAIKVRYPHVRETMDSDFKQLRMLGKLASLGTAVDGPALVAELHERLLEECDYRAEAESQDRFSRLFADDPTIHVPGVVADRCGDSVLTTHWCDGESFQSIRDASPDRRAAIARTLIRFAFRSVLCHRLLHADPHPGNFLFVADDRVVVLDFGCTKRLEPEFVDALANLARIVIDGERDGLRDAAIRLQLVPRPEKVDFDDLWDMMRHLFAPYLHPRFTFERDWWEQGMKFTQPTNRNARHLAVPPQWLWIQRTVWGLHAVLLKLEVQGSFRDILVDCLEAR